MQITDKYSQTIHGIQLLLNDIKPVENLCNPTFYTTLILRYLFSITAVYKHYIWDHKYL